MVYPISINSQYRWQPYEYTPSPLKPVLSTTVSPEQILQAWKILHSLTSSRNAEKFDPRFHNEAPIRAMQNPLILILIAGAVLASCADDHLTPDDPNQLDAGGRYTNDRVLLGETLPIDVGPFRRDVTLDHPSSDIPVEAACVPDPCASNVILPHPSRDTLRGVCLQFEESAARSGLSVSGVISGLSVFDVDGDGDPDIYILRNGAPNIFFRNEGGGRYRDSTSTLALAGSSNDSRDAVWGDYDGDRDADLALVGAQGTVLYQNNGSSFINLAPPNGIQDRSPGRTAFWIGAHLLVTTEDGNRYYRRQSGDSFSSNGIQEARDFGLANSGEGVSIAPWDVNVDGRMDYYVANATGPSHLYQQESDGHFIAVEDMYAIHPWSDARYHASDAAWVVYDPTRPAALHLANLSGRDYFFTRPVNQGAFMEVGSSLGLQNVGNTNRIAWGDFTGNLGSHLPFLFAGRVIQPSLFQIPQRRSDGSIERYLDFAHGLNLDAFGSVLAAKTLDYDGDGLMDLLVAYGPVTRLDTTTPGVRLFHNVSGVVRLCPRDQ